MRESMRLGDALEMIIDHRGKTPKKLGAQFVGEGVPVASALLVQGGCLDLANGRFVSTDTWRKWMSNPLKSGDVLLTSEAPLGRVARITSDDPLVLGQRLFALRPRSEVLDSRYLEKWLVSERGQSALAARASGSTVMGIRQSELREVRIDLPDLAIQRGIGEVLGVLDDKIAANRRLVALSVTLCEALVRRAAVGPRLALSEIAQITMGSSPQGRDLNEAGQGVPFFQGVRDFGALFPMERVYTTAPVRVAREGDTLLAVRAPVGEVNVARSATSIGRGLAAIHSDSSPVTTFYQLRANRGVWDEYEGTGTVFSAVNGPQVRATRLPSVPSDDREHVEATLAALHRRALAAEAESDILALARDELLPLLMSGRITVKDAESVVGEVV